MIYNDRTVSGVIIVRLSVMKEKKKVNLAVSKAGFGGGGVGHGLQVRPTAEVLSHPEIDKSIIGKYYNTTLTAYDDLVQGIAPNFQTRRQKSEETTFSTANLNSKSDIV